MKIVLFPPPGLKGGTRGAGAAGASSFCPSWGAVLTGAGRREQGAGSRWGCPFTKGFWWVKAFVCFLECGFSFVTKKMF